MNNTELNVLEAVSESSPNTEVEWAVADYCDFFRTVERVWKELQDQRRQFLVQHVVEGGSSKVNRILITTEPILSQKSDGSYWHQERIIICDKDDLSVLKEYPHYSLELVLKTFPNRIIEYKVNLSEEVASTLFISEPLKEIQPE